MNDTPYVREVVQVQARLIYQSISTEDPARRKISFEIDKLAFTEHPTDETAKQARAVLERLADAIDQTITGMLKQAIAEMRPENAENLVPNSDRSVSRSDSGEWATE